MKPEHAICRAVMVEVTAEDIANGEKSHTCRCPIARALLRKFPGHYVCVEIDHVDLGITLGRSETGDLPFEAREFIDHFDNDGPVEPFTFPLLVPESAFTAVERAS